MNYIKLPDMDNPVSVFDICQAHAQLESDYNIGGWLRERPSNKRRMEATSCQLSRIGYHMGGRWVNICEVDESDDPDDDAVRDIYLKNVLQLGLPIDNEMHTFMASRYVPEYLASFQNWRNQ